MDSIYLKLVIVALLLAIVGYLIHQSKQKDSPKYKQLKTYSNITYDRQEYYESDFKSTLLYLATLGHHEASIKSRNSYDNTYEQYSYIFNKVTELQEQINVGIAKLEQNISLTIKELKASSRLVTDVALIREVIEALKNTDKIDSQVNMIDGLGFTKVARLKTWFPSFTIFTGIMAGLLIIMVIWFLLLALGGSGTTLMSYLLVLAIMIIPIVAFSTFKSRANTKKFEQQDKALIEKIKAILDNSEKLENTIILLNTNNRELESYLNQLASINREVTAALYKNSAYIKAAKKSKALFKKGDYNKEEIELSSKINMVVDGLRIEVESSQLLG
ncbi:hypothetical protein [Psychrobacter jeotgali]|uniref:hypothetical protein n=1 Tax=Psychrobacter jeotgali TaxID=179010 RepID=UPI00191AD043|nr:hypothetical protein [Psychrobacter jeotgali]